MTKLKVIVADTDRDFCNSLRASLTDADGFELLAVTDSGVDAMEKVQRYQPDILICDLILPGIDGFELIARVRKLTIAKKPKISAWCGRNLLYGKTCRHPHFARTHAGLLRQPRANCAQFHLFGSP